MKVLPASSLNHKLLKSLIQKHQLQDVVELLGTSQDGHSVLLVCVRRDIPGLMRKVAEHIVEGVIQE